MAEWPFGKGVKPAIPVRWNYGGRHPLTSARVRMFSPFDPAWLFAGGEQGAWYDPSDLTTLYQDSAGTTPVTADGDPVGLMLDKSQGLVLGSNLVSNGEDWTGASGTTPPTGWTYSGVNALFNVVDGALEFDRNGDAANNLNWSFTSEVGKTYKASINVIDTGGANLEVLLQLGSNFETFLGTGIKEIVFTATSTTTSFGFRPSSGVAQTIIVDSASVKELPGNHSTQSTSGNKRIYRTDGTLHWLEDDLFDDAITAHLPDLGTNATLVYADGSGVTILTGQTISGDTNLPTVAQTYGVFYLDRPFNPDEEEAVTKYLNQLRGA